MKKLYLVIVNFFSLTLFAFDAGGVFFAFADLLIWEAKEENLDYTSSAPFGPQPPTGPSTFPFSLNRGTRYSPGFRVGVGYARDWEIVASWADYYSKSALLKQVGLPYMIPLFLNNDQDPVSFGPNAIAQGSWKLQYDVVDLVFGYPMVWGCFQFCPQLGARGAWIDQQVDALYTSLIYLGATFPLTDLASTTTNNFYGGGIRIGANGNWNFWRTFSLFSKSGLSLLYGQIKVDHHEFLAAPVSSGGVTFPRGMERAQVKLTSSGVVPAIDLTAGISSDFDLFRLHVNISVAWECQLWLSQNQMLQVLDDVGIISNSSLNGDLSLQGLTARLAVSF